MSPWLGLLLVLGLVLAGCRGTGKSSASRSAGAAPPAAEAKEGSRKGTAPRIRYSADYDAEIKEVLDLARQGRWEQAEALAEQLYDRDPQNPTVERLYTWVTAQRQQQRARALEDEIREIDASSSVFNPTVPELLKESKDRGLPPRKDVRDAIAQIEATPYIPPSYGRTNYLSGPMFDFESARGRMAQILEREVSVHLGNATLESIIFDIGQAEGINFVADKSLPAFKETLSLNLDKVTLRELLKYISRNLEVQFQVGDDLIWVVDAKDEKKLQHETRFYRLRKGFILPAQFGASEVTKVTTREQNRVIETETQKIEKFVNDNAPNTPSLEEAIKQFCGETLKYMIDYERNLVVASGTPEKLEILERILEEFDRPIQQVLIEARFITVSQPAFMRLGVVWETGRAFQASRAPQDFTGLVASESVPLIGLGIEETFTNILDSATLSATISALEQSGESQTLSAPRLTVVNNRPATISDGKVQYYYEEYQVYTTALTERNSASSFVPKGKPTKLQAGVELEVLASISGDGQSILLALHPKVSQDVKLVTYATLSDVDADGNIVSTFDIRLPEARTQELATRVIVRSGETVVMGGVLEREQTSYVESVPVLGSIPIIGALFRRRTEVDRPRYLLIFVTATILSETGEYIVYRDQEPVR